MTNKNVSKNYGFSAWREYLSILALACLFASCVSQQTHEKETVPAAAPAAEIKKTPSPTERLPSGNELDSPQFRNLPPEAKDYLETLAEAFQKKDKEFLVSQGESQYEKELRSRLDEETYLALLYRIGPYSEDSPWKPPTPQRLNASLIRAIEYTEWGENGPMLDIYGRLYLSNGDSLPCRIVLVWRLPEPKILGERP